MQKYIKTVGVVIATAGRREVVADTISSMGRLNYVPGCLVVVGATHKDLPDINTKLPFSVHSLVATEMGASIQRNQGFKKIDSTVKYVCFLDDDMEFHQDYFMEVEKVFDSDQRIAGFSGMVLANGNINRIHAREKLDAHEIHLEMPSFGFYPNKWPGFYGCNMNIRRDLLHAEVFDEKLPFNSFGEDCEMGFRLSYHGFVGGSARCPAVHLATKSGRISEVGLGYSQIINYLYFTQKHIGFPKIKTYWEKIIKKLIINLVLAIFSCLGLKSRVGRRGRFLGNMLAIGDVFKGQVNPMNLIKIMERNRLPH